MNGPPCCAPPSPQFDTDRSGALDADELKIALRVAMGAELSIEDCKQIIGDADRDGNGVVDFQEFCFVTRGEVCTSIPDAESEA